VKRYTGRYPNRTSLNRTLDRENFMKTAPPPNFLFFLPDQHRWDWTGANPNLPLRTPNLDALAGRGTRFTKAFCPSPLCAPSRACLASGKEYARCGVVNNSESYPLDQPTYYQSLRDLGYRVCGVGKFDLDKPTLSWGLDGSRLIRHWGFTEGGDSEGKFDGSNAYLRNGRSPTGPYLRYLAELGLADDYVKEHDKEIRKENKDAYTTCLPDHAYCDNWIGENGKRFLKAFPKDQPWHLVVNFAGPHNPMDVTASMRERWEEVAFPAPVENDQTEYLPEDHQRIRQNYAAMIENIDQLAGEMINIVEERGERDRTVVIYSSDHGEMLGDYGRWGKSTHHDPACRVPLVMAGPGVGEGRRVEGLVSLHDLTATFLEWAGAASLPGMDSMSLVSCLREGSQTPRDRLVVGLNDWTRVVSEERQG